MDRITRLLAVAALAALAAACSQKDPAASAISAAEDALTAVYEDAQKYIPERYAEVKAKLDDARKAFDEERYSDAIAAVKDVPAQAESLATEAAEAKQKFMDEMGAEWSRLSGSVPDLMGSIDARLGELGKMRRLPRGMDKKLLEEANAAAASAKSAWDEASADFTSGNLETAVDKARNVEAMARDLMARLGIEPASV